MKHNEKLHVICVLNMTNSIDSKKKGYQKGYRIPYRIGYQILQFLAKF